ncbi:MAG: shikimate dehydrogenase [Peptostreptococcaceae bacterium]
MINSETRLVALFGSPVKNSLSPFIHNYLYEKYKVNSIYTCFDIENIKEGIDSLKVLNFKGINVTIPHKVEVINYLDEIDFNAKFVGAVNTIKNENGILKGFNTDGDGFVKSILDTNYNLENKNVLVIGAGGSSRSICISLCNQKIKTLKIFNRTIEKALDIKNIIDENFETEALVSSEKIKELDLENIDVIINTTSIGMESDECPISRGIIPSENLLVCDIVYKPHETEFIKWAKSNSLNVIYGIDMLINQAFEGFYILNNIKPNKEDYNYIIKNII